MLSKEDILKNKVETINQYKVLQYLKNELNIYEFKVCLYDENTIKITDKNDKSLYFVYKNNQITFKEMLKNNDEELTL